MFSNKDVIVDKNSNNLEFLLSFSVTAAQYKQNAKRKAWLEMLHSKIPPSNCLFKKNMAFLNLVSQQNYLSHIIELDKKQNPNE